MKPNTETLKQKMEIIDKNFSYLQDKKGFFDPEEADFEELQAVKHSMFEIAEACIDIASHIIAAEGFERPSEYPEAFSVLEKEGIIGKELSGKLKDMARFRNFIAHRYDKVENQRLKQILEKDLQDVKGFTASIYEYMDKY